MTQDWNENLLKQQKFPHYPRAGHLISFLFVIASVSEAIQFCLDCFGLRPRNDVLLFSFFFITFNF
jgi:hypothetical protein